MIDSTPFDGDADRPGPGDDAVDLRLGNHAVGLLQAARDTGNRALIAQAEAMAMAVGFALAARLSVSDAD